MDEKRLSFAIDYLYIMFGFINMDPKTQHDHFLPILKDAIKFFLVGWNYSIPEIEEAEKIIVHELSNDTYDGIDAFNKFGEYFAGDRFLQEKFLIDMATLGLLNLNLSEEQKNVLNAMRLNFNISLSDFRQILDKATNLSSSLTVLGISYINSGVTIVI